MAEFIIREHQLEGQHLREYARATAHSQEEILKISIKQYIPKDNPTPQPGDVTIIAAHANGFPKELYEALWDELNKRSKANGFRIRGIWIADVAQQGHSSVLNEEHLGNDPGWFDHSRDLLHMINHFRAEMPMPLVGVGHSMGGCQLSNLALFHPRLFTTLVLLDPVIQDNNPSGAEGRAKIDTGYIPARMSTYRRDLWPSRIEAEAAFKKQKFYQSWDPRVLDAWLKYGLRDTPTLQYPDEKGSVTLTATRANEVHTFLRPVVNENEQSYDIDDSYKHPDIFAPFYRNEIADVFWRIVHLRPSAFFVFGGKSDMSQPPAIKAKMDRVGTKVGGSGGYKAGRVDYTVLKDIGHLVAMEVPELCADKAAPWIGKELNRWAKEMEVYKEWTKKSTMEKTGITDSFRERIGPLPRKGASPKSKI